ncbi:MAG: M13 family metallopeptidase N-terminal domain-containing protein [Burkholderiaceae bacterium]
MNQALTWQGGLEPAGPRLLPEEGRRAPGQGRAAYKAYLTTLATLAGMKDPAAIAQRVLAIEQRIAEAHWDKVENRNPVKIYNPMTTAELEKAAPGVDWRTFLQAASLGQVEKLSVSQPSEVTAAAKLFAEVPLDDWKLYFKLHSLDNAAPVLPKAFRDALCLPRHGADGGQGREAALATGHHRAQRCTRRGRGPALRGAVLPAQEYKARMQTLVGNLLATYKESIDGLTWMTPATKAQAQDKLSKYMTKIGYPDQWRDYSKLEVRAGDPLAAACARPASSGTASRCAPASRWTAPKWA